MNEEEIPGEDPLEEIFVKENQPADKRLLADILKQFVTIDTKGILSPTEKYDKLKESEKALVYMLCKKAMVLREMPEIIEKTTIKEISHKARISESSAKNALFTYYKKIVKDGMIPNHNLRKVKDTLIKNE